MNFIFIEKLYLLKRNFCYVLVKNFIIIFKVFLEYGKIKFWMGFEGFEKKYEIF